MQIITGESLSSLMIGAPPSVASHGPLSQSVRGGERSGLGSMITNRKEYLEESVNAYNKAIKLKRGSSDLFDGLGQVRM